MVCAKQWPGAPRAQRGVSLSGLVMGAFVLVVVSIFGFKLMPAYIEYFTIKKTVAALAQDPSLKGATPNEVRKAFDRRATIDNITAVKADELEIGKDGNLRTISVAWPVRIRIVGNVNACIDFEAASSGQE